MKTREWWLVIGIIILVQFIVQMAAWLFGTNDSALSYISFAGTIVSIILALLAIVYSFVNSMTQQNSANTISNQVDKLMDVSNEITSSKKELGKSLEFLTSVSEKIDTSLEFQDMTHQSVQNLQNSMNQMSSQMDDLSKSETSAYSQTQTSAEQNIFIRPFTHGSNRIAINSIIIYYGAKHKLSPNGCLDFLVDKFFRDTIDFGDDPESSVKQFIDREKEDIRCSLLFLDAFGCLSVNDDWNEEYNLVPEFKTECEDFIAFILETDGDESLTKNTINYFESIECIEKKKA